jgi:hypothetical protein
VAQFTSNGILDTNFNGTGMATTKIPPGLDWARDVKFTGPGKIVLAGSNAVDYNYNIALAQFQTTGGGGRGVIDVDVPDVEPPLARTNDATTPQVDQTGKPLDGSR